MQKTLLVLAVVLLVGAGGYFGYTKYGVQGSEQPEGVACTEEAKLCPDGITYVGRQGPDCAFAACPSLPDASATTTLELSINQTGSAQGVTITPLSVVQDSRCPIDVQCIQAGTVQLKVTINGNSGLGDYNTTLTLGKSVTNEGETVTLTAVTPSKISTKTIGTSDYRFTIAVAKR